MTEDLKTALLRILDEADQAHATRDELAQLLADVIPAWTEQQTAPADFDTVHVASVVSASSGDPFVACRVGREKWQWTPADARKHAGSLLEVAEAATHDAAMVRWMTLGPMEMEHHLAVAALQDLRRYRGDSS